MLFLVVNKFLLCGMIRAREKVSEMRCIPEGVQSGAQRREHTPDSFPLDQTQSPGSQRTKSASLKAIQR